MAFENDGWPGTDTESLRSTLREIPSKEEFAKVVKSYQKLYNGNLIKDMSDELQSTEYNEMLQILAAKPDKKGQAPSPIAYTAWAKRMKAAFDKEYGFFGGTDAEAIIAVFNEIPTQTAFVKVAVEYKRLYGTNMLEDMKSESEFGQYDDWMKIITAKRK
jgi:predicted acetyltransferase